MKRERIILKSGLASLVLTASSQAFGCFTVFSPGNHVIYHSVEPPVDMSLQIHETLPSVFPGGHMVFDLSTDCFNSQSPTRHVPSRNGQHSTLVRVVSESGTGATIEQFTQALQSNWARHLTWQP